METAMPSFLFLIKLCAQVRSQYFLSKAISVPLTLWDRLGGLTNLIYSLHSLTLALKVF
jgi:hypothetical protein